MSDDPVATAAKKSLRADLPPTDTAPSKPLKVALPPKSTGGRRRYPKPGDFHDHELTRKVNKFFNKFDPDGELATECEVGESFTAAAHYYRDADVHPLAWVALNMGMFGAGLAYKKWFGDEPKPATVEGAVPPKPPGKWKSALSAGVRK